MPKESRAIERRKLWATRCNVAKENPMDYLMFTRIPCPNRENSMRGPRNISFKRIRFSDEIRRRLAEQNMSTQKAAELLGVPSSTLRTILSRNRFSEHIAIALSGLLNMPTSPRELLDQYAFCNGSWARTRRKSSGARASLMESFRASDRRQPGAEGDHSRFLLELGQLIASMHETDLAVFCSSTVTPPEFEVDSGHQLTQHIAKAIENGATFLYIRADSSVFAEYSSVWHLPNLKPVMEGTGEFSVFRNTLILVLKESGMPPAKAEEIVAARILQIKCDRSPFFAPGFLIGMFQSDDDYNRRHRRMLVRVPGAFTGVIYRRPDELFEARFSDFALMTVKAAIATCSSQVKDPLNVSLDSSTSINSLRELEHCLESHVRWNSE